MKKDTSFWYSKIQSYNQCPRKFKLEHIDKTLKTEKSAAMEFGTAMHLGIQACFEGDDPKLLFSTYWNSVDKRLFGHGEASFSELEGVGHTLLDRFVRLHLKHFKPILIEERQFGTIGKHDFEGTPDFYGDYKGIRSIVDFKTAQYPYIKEKAAIADQLMGYAHLLSQNNHELPKQIVYVVFCKRDVRIQVITFPLTKELLTTIVGNMNQQINRIKADNEYPMALNSCPMYKSACVCASKLYKEFKCKDSE